MKITERRLRSIIRNVIKENRLAGGDLQTCILHAEDMIKDQLYKKKGVLPLSVFAKNPYPGDDESFLFENGDEMEKFVIAVAESVSSGMGGYGGTGGIYPTVSGTVSDEMLAKLLPSYEVFQSSGCRDFKQLAAAIGNLACQMIR